MFTPLASRLTKCVLPLVLLAAPAALAGTVQQMISSQEGWVGTPITISFLFEDVQSHEPPTIPSVRGLTISSTGPPSVRSNSVTINGRRTSHSSLTYRYHVMAEAPGTYTLPAIDLFADGSTWTAEPFVLTFRSMDDPDLLQAELLNIPDHAWLGDVIPVTLRVLAKPFASQELSEGALSAADMWRLVQLNKSRWGPFQNRIEELVGQKRFPALSVVEMAGSDGVTSRWYAYDLRIKMPLLQAGTLDLSNIMVAMDYPLQIGRGRSSFLQPFPSLTVTNSRLVTATPAATTLVVETPPEQGRPPTWAGAVGQFRFDVTASHTEATVGEPITLTMKITDIGSHAADLDLLQAPRLDADRGLTSHFRVPADRPGGVVSGRTKTFTQTIRPTSSGVDLVPPIPFTFFDPQRGVYDTAFSRPIDISVSGARQVDASDVGGIAQGATARLSGVTSVHGGLLANYTDTEALLTRPRRAGGAVLATIVVAPPLAFVLLTGARRRRLAAERDPSRSRARRAARVLADRLSHAHGSPAAFAAAIRDFIADKFGLAAAGFTRADAVAAVRSSGHEAMADTVDEALRGLEQRIYAGSAGALDAAAADEMTALCRQLENTLR
jgi:hypothetical protein